jgi:phosphoribosylamine--glycine ligase
MISRQGNATMKAGFSAAIVLTIPPFPYDRKSIAEPVGLPVSFDGGLSEQDREHLFYGEVGLCNGDLVTSGLYGWTMVATGVSDTIEKARSKAYELADRVIIPNVRYRRDIGSSLIEGDFALIEKLELLD